MLLREVFLEGLSSLELRINLEASLEQIHISFGSILFFYARREHDLGTSRESGICVEKATNSEWVKPVVPIPKADGRNGDFRVTVNTENRSISIASSEDLFLPYQRSTFR